MTDTGSYRVSIVVDRSRFPKLFRFVEWRIDVQLAEVRELLRLPMPEVGLKSGQTFAAAGALVNLIAGASLWLYDASTAGLSDRESGRRFRETLAAYWPWDDGEIVDKDEGIRLLYECLRNPLAHGFGMSRLDDESSPIAFLKESLTAECVAELDLAEARPQGIGPTFRPAGVGAPARAYLVAVPALYWGVQRLLRAVLTLPTSISCQPPRNSRTRSCDTCPRHERWETQHIPRLSGCKVSELAFGTGRGSTGILNAAEPLQRGCRSSA